MARDCAEQLDDPTKALNGLVYGMSVLAGHDRRGGLKEPQIRFLLQTIEGILRIYIQTPETSRLSYLWREFYMAKSLIYRREGEPWLSAWELEMASRHRSAEGGVHESFNDLGRGVRLLRFGSAAMAMRYFKAAEDSDLPQRQRLVARVGRIQGHRLRGELATAEALVAEALQYRELSEAERLDLEWHRLCIGIQDGGKLQPLIKAVSAKGSHRAAGYFLEAFLWGRIKGTGRTGK
jgi:hypothetical protein